MVDCCSASSTASPRDRSPKSHEDCDEWRQSHCAPERLMNFVAFNVGTGPRSNPSRCGRSVRRFGDPSSRSLLLNWVKPWQSWPSIAKRWGVPFTAAGTPHHFAGRASRSPVCLRPRTPNAKTFGILSIQKPLLPAFLFLSTIQRCPSERLKRARHLCLVTCVTISYPRSYSSQIRGLRSSLCLRW